MKNLLNQTIQKNINESFIIKKTEFITPLRTPPDEDGIWHDDGSREMAFSIGLNLQPKNIEGGKFLFREKGTEEYLEFPPLAWGQLLIFATGTDGFEHRVLKVTKGQRLVIAGWLN